MSDKASCERNSDGNGKRREKREERKEVVLIIKGGVRKGSANKGI